MYIKNMLESEPSIDRCAIIGVPDGSLWTKSKPPNGKDFEVSTACRARPFCFVMMAELAGDMRRLRGMGGLLEAEN